MNRFMKGGLLELLFLSTSAPAYAANLPLLDPNFSIVPVCPTGGPLSAGAILQFIQNIMNAMISVGVIAMVLIIAYAGFLFILTPTNPEARSKAKSMLGNAVIGFIIVLAAWIGVDFIMKLLYSDSTQTSFGPWNKILTVTDSSQCIEEVTISGIKGLPGLVDVGINPLVIGNGGGGGPGASSIGVGDARLGTGACSPSSVASGAGAGGYRLSGAQANTLSCIALFESNCGATQLNYNWNKGSSAAGMFQVTLDGNSACYENAPCRSAAGVQGALNCSAGFRNGNPIPGSAIAERCVRAAKSNTCSSAAAACVLQKQGYGAWQADSHSSKQAQCVAKFSNG